MGGNVFADKTSNILRENITPTLDTYFKELTALFPSKAVVFNELHFCPLGSVRKKEYSGDIDLGIDVSHLLDSNKSDEAIQAWNIDPAFVTSTFEVLKKRARTATDDDLRIKAFLKCLAEYINQHAPNLHCDVKKVTNGNLFGLYPQFDSTYQKLSRGVQIDWMVGNIDWLKFSYYSSPYPKDSNVKGLHRTQLILAAFQIANLSFNHVTGVKDKTNTKIVASTPAAALSVLSDRLGFTVSEVVAQDYYALHHLLKDNLRNGEYQALLNIYFKILDSTRADIPNNLHELWIKNRLHLGLTGKFLPDDSKLKEVL